MEFNELLTRLAHGRWATHDSAESIVTLPPGSDLDDEQIRALLASPLHLQEREENAQQSQGYTVNEKTSCPSHLKIR